MRHGIKKPCRKSCKAIFTGGRGWIRTTEVTDNRFTVCPLWPLGNSPIFTLLRCGKIGAGRRTRTPDLLITNQLLYQLSYTSLNFRSCYSFKRLLQYITLVGFCQALFL